jgi:hypothetical protein
MSLVGVEDARGARLYLLRRTATDPEDELIVNQRMRNADI